MVGACGLSDISAVQYIHLAASRVRSSIMAVAAESTASRSPTLRTNATASVVSITTNIATIARMEMDGTFFIGSMLDRQLDL